MYGVRGTKLAFTLRAESGQARGEDEGQGDREDGQEEEEGEGEGR